jgi:hypothetical protein
VSPRLRNELEKRYDELTPIYGNGIPRTQFFSFRDFALQLLLLYRIRDFKATQICNVHGYLLSKKSWGKSVIEAHLLENEIGGVIMGSVTAAEQQMPLTRSQYLTDKRSNIQNKTDEGIRLRNLVFDEYEGYSSWKYSNRSHDMSDIVLRLLSAKREQLFSAGKGAGRIIVIIVVCRTWLYSQI